MKVAECLGQPHPTIIIIKLIYIMMITMIIIMIIVILVIVQLIILTNITLATRITTIVIVIVLEQLPVALASEQFWMYLILDMVAPQTFARTFTKPGFRLY